MSIGVYSSDGIFSESLFHFRRIRGSFMVLQTFNFEALMLTDQYCIGKHSKTGEYFEVPVQTVNRK